MKNIINLAALITFILASSVSSCVLSMDVKTGTVIGKNIFGLANDVQDDPLMIGMEPLIYMSSKSSSVLSVGERSFMVDAFDGVVASVYISELESESKLPLDTRALPLGSIGGVHGATALYKTSWNTALFSENRFVNAADSNEFAEEFKPYFKNNSESVNPYHYGWLNEIIVLDSEGSAKAIKTYAAGRLFASSFLVMPDSKTAYFHDRHSGNLYIFISEEANSLAKGVLYVVDGGNNGTLVELGKSSALKMKFKLKKVEFSKLFKQEAPDGGVCKQGYDYISTIYGEECLKVQKKNRKYIGQLEPIRATAIKGVKPFLPSVEQIKLSSNKTEIIVIDNNAQEKRYSLVKDKEYGSDFIIR